MTMNEAIFEYKFKDGTELKLLNVGFSVEELWTLEKLHGKCEIRYKNCGARMDEE